MTGGYIVLDKKTLEGLLKDCKTQAEMIHIIKEYGIKTKSLSVSGLNYILDTAYKLPKS